MAFPPWFLAASQWWPCLLRSLAAASHDDPASIHSLMFFDGARKFNQASPSPYFSCSRSDPLATLLRAPFANPFIHRTAAIWQ